MQVEIVSAPTIPTQVFSLTYYMTHWRYMYHRTETPSDLQQAPVDLDTDYASAISSHFPTQQLKIVSVARTEIQFSEFHSSPFCQDSIMYLCNVYAKGSESE